MSVGSQVLCVDSRINEAPMPVLMSALVLDVGAGAGAAAVVVPAVLFNLGAGPGVGPISNDDYIC